VRVNDRGPFHEGRLIDVSVRTAKLLGFHQNGVARVRVDYVGRAALEGSDDDKLAATLRRGAPAPGPSEVRLASVRSFPPESLSLAARQVVSNAQPPSFDTRFAPTASIPAVAARAEPVSAYAPAVPGASNGAVMSGRGLY